ncbi:MAG: phosphohistidine phosphatase [Bacteroidia bacterium]|jgi:phosphohistidine phosphatase
MKTLTILRHAKSDWSHPDLSDHDRPLNKRGNGDLPKIAHRFVELNIRLDACIHSTAIRATTTALQVLNMASIEVPTFAQHNLYTFEGKEVITIIHHLDNLYHEVLMVGHNPAFTEVINLLSNIRLDNLPTGGMAQIQFDSNRWEECRIGSGKLIFLEHPKGY